MNGFLGRAATTLGRLGVSRGLGFPGQQTQIVQPPVRILVANTSPTQPPVVLTIQLPEQA